jgi:tetratricopeptide (TPR) repeat protein
MVTLAGMRYISIVAVADSRRSSEPVRARAFVGAGAAVFAIALAIRLVHLWQIRHAPFFDVLLGDARGYDEWAQRIAAGDWIGREPFFQAPLYPYFLAAVYRTLGRDLFAVRLCQALVGATSCVLLAVAGRRLFGPRVGVIAGLGLALYAPAIFFDGLLQKSVLDVFFMCLSLWILSGLVDDPARRPSWFALGLALGGLSLTRENAMAVVAVVVAWAVVEGRRALASTFAALAWFAVGLALLLLPVVAHNYRTGGEVYLTSWQAGQNLYIGNNASATGTYVPLRYGRVAPEYERQDAIDLAERALGRRLTPREVSGYWTGQALDYITSHPIAWLRLMGRKLLLLLNAREAVDTESQHTYAEWSLPLTMTGWIANFGVLVPLTVIGLWASWAERRRLWVFYALAVAYSASVLVFYVFARYRLPLVPVLMLFAASGILAIPGLIRNLTADRRPAASPRPRGKRAAAPPAGAPPKRPWAALAAIIVAAIIANWPVLSVSTMEAVTENNLARALEVNGHGDEAIAHYERATTLDPAYAPSYNNLATALRARGDLNRAIAMYERALALQPDYPDVHYNLGNTLVQQHRLADAIAHYRQALALNPAFADAANNLGTALLRAGRIDEAIPVLERALEVGPDSLLARRNLADALTLAGRPDDALPHLRRAAALSPDDGSIHYDIGSVLLAQNKTAEAIDELRRAIALAPGLVQAHNDLGVALLRTRKIDEATKQFQAALALQPGYTDAADNLAMIERAVRAGAAR